MLSFLKALSVLEARTVKLRSRNFPSRAEDKSTLSKECQGLIQPSRENLPLALSP